MEYNDILSKDLIRRINKIEKEDAKIQQEKENALIEIRKQISKSTFEDILDKIIEEGYENEKANVEEIKEKQRNKQKVEYDDYISILKMYENIAPNITEK